MTRTFKIFTALIFLVLATFALLHTGLARKAFFELFAYVKKVDVLGPTIVRYPPYHSPYETWLKQARTKIPIHEGMFIDDVEHIPLRPWPQLGDGVTGLYLRFADYQVTDGRIVQIPSGGSTFSQRRMYEQNIYLLSGSGYTILQQEGEQEQRIEWKQGDLFSVPLNASHQHFTNSNESARMLVVSSFPLVLNVFRSEGFIEENPFVFSDRYDAAGDYFERTERRDELTVVSNYVENLPNAETRRWEYRGKGATTMRYVMAGNSMLSLHISEMPPGSYKKAHRHSNDAFILVLSGTGFSLSWPEGAFQDHHRVDWKAGTLFVPPTYWYHQHLNTGLTPARYLAIATPSFVKNIGLRFADQLEVDIEEVRDEWKQALEKASRAEQ